MIYAVSDIHGHYREFAELLSKIDLKYTDKLILLGDYIDNGNESFMVLNKIYELSKNSNVIALRGNHEEWFLNWLSGKDEAWITADKDFETVRTFLSQNQLTELEKIINNIGIFNGYDFIRNIIKGLHKELVDWIKALPYYYQTDTRLFVHAGVDEELGEYWKFGTTENIYTEKYPLTTGSFYLDVISGHIAASTVAKNSELDGIYFDGKSHYFIDGGVSGKEGRLLCLAYNEETKKYYEFDGEFKPI